MVNCQVLWDAPLEADSLRIVYVAVKNLNTGKKKRNQALQRVLVVVLSIAVLVGFVLFDKDVQRLDNVLAAMSPWWLIGALLCVLLYFLGDTTMYLIACRDMGARQPFFEGLITTMIGFFYSALTPLASGGQPFQVIQMRARGINVGTATSVLMVKFMAWHIAMSIVGALGFIFCGQMLLNESSTMFVMFIVGYLLHALCAAAGFLLMLRPALVQRAGNAVVGFLGRLLFRRKPERTGRIQKAWDGFVSDYKQAVAFAVRHRMGMLCIVLTALAEVLAYLGTTWFVYRGLGLDGVGFWTMTLMQAALSISVAFVPLPGASIATEGGFYAVFTRFFGEARLVGMLIWRALTYYLAILLGLAAVLIDGLRKNVRTSGDERTGELKNVSGGEMERF